MMLCDVTILAFIFVDDNARWPHLGFWLVICSTLAFYFDAVREATETLALQPNLDRNRRLVVFLAGLATRVGLGCLAGNCMRAFFETLLPLPSGNHDIGVKACGAMLPGTIFAVVANFGNGYIVRRHKL